VQGSQSQGTEGVMTNHEHAVRDIGRRMVKEEIRSAGFDTVFPAGTILSCSDCGEGLCKVTTRATTADIVLGDRTYSLTAQHNDPTVQGVQAMPA